MTRIAALAIALALAGCDKSEPVPVQVVANTWCQAAKPIAWHVDDTAETAWQAEAHNRAIAKACPKKRKQRIAKS